MTAEAFYKILGPNREAIHGGTGVWPVPGEWLRVTVTPVDPPDAEQMIRALRRVHTLAGQLANHDIDLLELGITHQEDTIRGLIRGGYTPDQIAAALQELGRGVGVTA